MHKRSERHLREIHQIALEIAECTKDQKTIHQAATCFLEKHQPTEGLPTVSILIRQRRLQVFLNQLRNAVRLQDDFVKNMPIVIDGD